MEQPPSAKIMKLLIIFVVAVFAIKSVGNAGLFESKVYKGKGYVVIIPEGWQRVKKQKGALYPEGVEVALFVPKGAEVSREQTKIFITILAKKLTTPIWIQDEFPEIIQSIVRQGFQVMDKGEIKIDDVISEWVVYHDKKTPALTLEFYMVTDANMFYKLQYSAPPDQFNAVRRSFEDLKNSFKFRFSLY